MPDKSEDGGGIRRKDHVPDVGVPGLPGEELSGGPLADTVRMLDGEAFVSLYRDLQIRREQDPQARLGSEATPDSFVVETQPKAPEPVVVPSPGVDEGEASPLPPRPWWT